MRGSCGVNVCLTLRELFFGKVSLVVRVNDDTRSKKKHEVKLILKLFHFPYCSIEGNIKLIWSCQSFIFHFVPSKKISSLLCNSPRKVFHFPNCFIKA